MRYRGYSTLFFIMTDGGNLNMKLFKCESKGCFVLSLNGSDR